MVSRHSKERFGYSQYKCMDSYVRQTESKCSYFPENCKYSHKCYFLTCLLYILQGLIKAVSEIFPHSEHRFCVRHLWQNFNQLYKGEVLKNQLWKIARSTTIQRWEEAREQMKVLDKDAYVSGGGPRVPQS